MKWLLGDGGNLRLRLTMLEKQTFDGLLELVVLGGVDERVDAAVGEHQDHGEVVEPVDESFSVVKR